MTSFCRFGPVDRVDAKGFALLAIGGYGRRTLHPESDLDLLLFFKDKVDEGVVKAVLDPLWDLPFRVGHQIRLASDFKAFDSTHIESYAAFLDNRYLGGTRRLLPSSKEKFFQDFSGAIAMHFCADCSKPSASGTRRFGHTVFQLEPDLKDAPGGVRDFHWADWVRKSLEGPAEKDLERTLAFHHCMRTFLHFQARRNFNVLSYEYQEQIAPLLGYSESPHGEAAETMMRDYFLRASEMAQRASMWEEEIGGSRNRIAISVGFQRSVRDD